MFLVFETSISYSLKKIFQTCMSGIYAEMLSTQIQLDLTKFVRCVFAIQIFNRIMKMICKNFIRSGNHGSADYKRINRVLTTSIITPKVGQIISVMKT